MNKMQCSQTVKSLFVMQSSSKNDSQKFWRTAKARTRALWEWPPLVSSWKVFYVVAASMPVEIPMFSTISVVLDNFEVILNHKQHTLTIRFLFDVYGSYCYNVLA